MSLRTLGTLALCLFAPATGFAQELTDQELMGWLGHVVALERQAEGRSGDGEVLLQLADAYAHIGDASRARTMAERAARAGIPVVRARLVLADMAWRWGEYDEAARLYLDVLAAHPDQPHALVQLWKLLYAVTTQGLTTAFDRADVIVRLRQAGLFFPPRIRTGAAADAPRIERRIVEANALLSRNAADAAVVVLEETAAFNPSASEIYRALARAYAQQFDSRRAAGSTLLYLALRPDAPEARELRRWLLDLWRERP